MNLFKLQFKTTIIGYQSGEFKFGHKSDIIFLLTGLRIYTGEYKAQGPT